MLLDHVINVLDQYEKELGPRSSGLAYLQNYREHLIKVIDAADKRMISLIKDNEQLRYNLVPRLPNFNLKMDMSECQTIAEISYIEWRLPQLQYRYPADNYTIKSENFWKRAKWQAYRAFCKRLRKEFETAFDNYHKMVSR